jgi:16S rRNA processing protein RimM
MAQRDRVCVGLIAGAHGVRGLVKLKSFTADPAAIVSYGPLTDEAGARSFRIELAGSVKDHLLARIEGVGDRDRAEALRGTRLHVERERLPEPEDEDEFYHADLIGLEAVLPDGTPFGTVVAVYDFGAGDMLELRQGAASGKAAGGTVTVPFTRAAVPVVDVKAGRITVDPPAGLLEPPERPPEDEAGEPEIGEPGAGE